MATATATITLYSKALNTGNGEYNVNLYNGLTYLNTYKVAELTAQNWRYNSEAIRLAIDTSLTMAKARTVVYIHVVTTDGDDTWHLVDSITIQSGYVIYFCHVDLWGTYYKKAIISNLRLARTNRTYGTCQAMFPPIQQTYNDTIEYLPTGLQKLAGEQDCAEDDIFYSYLTVMFSLKYNIYQTVNSAVTEIGMFAIPFNRLISQYETDTGDTSLLVNIMELVQQVMGGIYAIEINGTELSAEVMGVWVVEDKAITTAYSDHKIKFRTAIADFDDNKIILDKVKPYQVDDARYKRVFTIQQNPQYEYYFGTYNEQMKLPRYVGDTNIVLKFIVEADKLRVIASCGTEEKDITSAFGLTVTHVDGDVRNVAYILNAMQSGIKLAGAGATMVAGAFSGNELAGVMGGMNLISGISELAKTNSRTGTVVDSGDAMTTYWISAIANNKKVHNPYVLHKYESIIDEEEVITHTGAIYGDYVTSVDLTNETPLITGDSTCFVKFDEVTIDNIPTYASEYIAGKLRQGIYIINEP